MSNDSVWLMCCCWWHICYRSLLAILRKKVGKPKEEIKNLYGFHVNSYNVWIRWYDFLCVNSHNLWIHIIRIYFLHCPLRLFPWARHSSSPWQDSLCHRWTNRKWIQKTPPTTHLNVRWRKRIRGKKWKPQYNSCYELSSQGHVEWSTIWQNPAYVNALSIPFTQ